MFAQRAKYADRRELQRDVRDIVTERCLWCRQAPRDRQAALRAIRGRRASGSGEEQCIARVQKCAAAKRWYEHRQALRCGALRNMRGARTRERYAARTENRRAGAYARLRARGVVAASAARYAPSMPCCLRRHDTPLPLFRLMPMPILMMPALPRRWCRAYYYFRYAIDIAFSSLMLIITIDIFDIFIIFAIDYFSFHFSSFFIIFFHWYLFFAFFFRFSFFAVIAAMMRARALARAPPCARMPMLCHGATRYAAAMLDDAMMPARAMLFLFLFIISFSSFFFRRHFTPLRYFHYWYLMPLPLLLLFRYFRCFAFRLLIISLRFHYFRLLFLRRFFHYWSLMIISSPPLFSLMSFLMILSLFHFHYHFLSLLLSFSIRHTII